MARVKIIGIYKIENKIDGKIYIGQSMDITTRWTRHKRELNRGTHKNLYLQRAWNKYTEESFEFTIIFQCNKCELDKIEKECIFHYDSNNYLKGYNQDSGGTQGKVLNKSVTDKIRTTRDYGNGVDKALTKKDIIDIRKLAYNGMCIDDITVKFESTRGIIKDIVNVRTYKNIKTIYDEELISRIGEYDKKTVDKITLVKKYLLLNSDKKYSEMQKDIGMPKSIIARISRGESYAGIFEEVNEKLAGLYGEKRAKIYTIEEISEIKKYMTINSNMTNIELAQKYGVSYGLIKDIKYLHVHIDICSELNEVLTRMYPRVTTKNILEEEIVEIKTSMVNSDISNVEIAEKYGMDQSSISNIRLLKTYVRVASEYNKKLKELYGNNKYIVPSSDKISFIKKTLCEESNTNAYWGNYFEVDPSTISRIKNVKAYKDVSPEYNESLLNKYTNQK